MKGVDLFCASPASTAICTGAAVYHPVIRHSGRSSIDRRPNHLPRRPHQPLLPCSSKSMPVTPRPYYRSSSSSSSSAASKLLRNVDQRRKSSADIRDVAAGPVGSARYLLSDVAFADLLPESERLTALVPALPPVPAKTRKTLPSSEPPTAAAVLSTSRSARSRDQVVVLRVSLHCRGCESKLKKHLAKIEGVTSFSIDMETKKVTIRGDITPLSILSSVSRVKYAQLWQQQQSSSSSPSTWSA